MNTESNAKYRRFEDIDNAPDDPTSDTDILSAILNDENMSQEQRYQLAEIFERAARKLRNPTERKYENVISEETMESSDIIGEIRKRKIPRRVAENIFLITLVWQLISVAALACVDGLARETFVQHQKTYFITGIVIMVVFQMSNLILCIAVTLKLFKQYRNKHTSMKFLLYSYAATLFLFGGMYTFIAWIYPVAFDIRKDNTSKSRALQLFAELLFMSISTGTLCGAAKVTGTHALSQAIMSLQMLLSFLYFASILSEVMNPSPATSQISNAKSEGGSEHTSFISRAKNTLRSKLVFQNERRKKLIDLDNL